MPKVTEAYLDVRRQQIIEAAYRCFARKGFHQSTMRDIYAEADLSPGAIYHYFNSKEDIIEASFIFDHQRSLPVLERAIDDPNPLVAIDHIMDFFFAGLESAAALGANQVNIQGWGEALVNPRLFTPLSQSFHDIQELLGRLIRGGQAAGTIDQGINPEAAGEVLLSSYLGLYLQKALNPEMNVEAYKNVVTALFHGNFAKK